MLELLLIGILFSTPLLCSSIESNDEEEKPEEEEPSTTYPYNFLSNNDQNFYNSITNNNYKTKTFTSSGYDPIREVWWKREDKWDITN